MKLALGTAQFGLSYGIANRSGQVTELEATGIIHQALAVGIDTIDTAMAYGTSESILGRIGVERFDVVTKLPAVPGALSSSSDLAVAEWVIGEIRSSMTRLRTNQLHAILLHHPYDLLGQYGSALWGALKRVKADGMTRKIGVSIYDTGELPALFDFADIDLVQAPLNILDRRLVETGWVDRLKTAGVEVHLRSAFLQGLLLLPQAERPAKFDRWNDVWKVWSGWLASNDLTALQGCLRYAASIAPADKLVVGVESRVQLAEILEAMDGPIGALPVWPELIDPVLLDPAQWGGI